METSNKKMASKLIFLFAFTYFISYITRINYGAVISEMVTDTGLSKSALSWALTGAFITYGAGQLISGYFGDRIQPKKLVTSGLCTTVLMNILIPFCSNTVQMSILWCINGFAQAFMWPPIVKLMTATLSPSDYARGCVKVSWGSSFGTIFIYLAAPVMIMLSGWKSVFFLCACGGIVGILLWHKNCPTIEMAPKNIDASEKKISGEKMVTPLMLFIMLAIVLQGILRDGVTTWMPSYISETYNLRNEISILTGILLPLFGMGCYQVASYLYAKKLKNPLMCSGAIFGGGAVAALLLFLLSNANAAFSVILSALLSACMHGVNLVLICIVPPLLAKKGKESTVSGLLNCCTYVGSAISSYIIPLWAENAGWTSTILMWFTIAAAGTAICFLCVPAWNK